MQRIGHFPTLHQLTNIFPPSFNHREHEQLSFKPTLVIRESLDLPGYVFVSIQLKHPDSEK